MNERHHYSKKPEPGYHERLEQAVDRYFVPDSKGKVAFQDAQIYREHPELRNYEHYSELVDLIRQMAMTIYQYRNLEE